MIAEQNRLGERAGVYPQEQRQLPNFQFREIAPVPLGIKGHETIRFHQRMRTNNEIG
jgi:hypothetical protein